MEEELEAPDKTEQQIYRDIELNNAFQGMHQCRLCPEKVIESDLGLAEHLASKCHKLRLRRHFKQHRSQLRKLIAKAKAATNRKYLFSTTKLQKVARFGCHFKLMAQITL